MAGTSTEQAIDDAQDEARVNAIADKSRTGVNYPDPEGPLLMDRDIDLEGHTIRNGVIEGLSGDVPGPTGPTGDTGPAGDTGPQGIQGVKGDTGDPGPTGPQGVIGATGAKGDTGNNGLDGSDGADGTNGSPGATGAKGDTGDPGADGLDGADGAQGVPGVDGVDGATGPTGPKGDQGDTGPQGVQGVPGADSTVAGPAGAKGDTGDQGIQGIQGVPGSDGADGADSVVAGPIGLTGPQGPQGNPGADGQDGADGAAGPQGPAGADGSDGSATAITQRWISTMRTYFYADLRWISMSDDNYGQNTENASESAGTGADPIYEWEVQGMPFRAGDRITDMDIRGRTNSTEVTDIEIYVVYLKPNPITRWETGFDNDAEDSFEVLYRDLWKNPTGPTNETLTGALNDRMKRKIDLDYNVADDGELRVFFKPVGTLTATRYFYPTVMTHFIVDGSTA